VAIASALIVMAAGATAAAQSDPSSIELVADRARPEVAGPRATGKCCSSSPTASTTRARSRATGSRSRLRT